MNTEVVKRDELEQEIAPVVAKAKSIVVQDEESYERAGLACIAVAGMIKTVNEKLDPVVKKAHEAHKAATSLRNEMLAPLNEAKRILTQRQLKWSQDQERIRQEEQRRLQAKADEDARKDRERLEKEASKLKTPELKEARLEAAQAVVAPVVQVASTAPTIKGQSIRKTIKAQVDDQRAAIMALMQFADWSAYVTLNEGELNRFAARTKGSVSIPGVTYYEDAVMSSRAR